MTTKPIVIGVVSLDLLIPVIGVICSTILLEALAFSPTAFRPDSKASSTAELGFALIKNVPSIGSLMEKCSTLSGCSGLTM